MMKKVFNLLAVLVPALISTSAFAKPDIKMVCKLDVTESSGRQEFLTQKMFFTSEASTEIFGETGEVALGYEGYGAVITNSSKGMVVVMIDNGKPVLTKIIPYAKSEFKISARIQNLKFDRLNLDCGGALIRSN